MLTQEQIEIRRQGITATDIAAIVGCHPMRAPIEVFREKLGTGEPFDGNLRTKWGNLLEPTIREDYCERYGVRVNVVGTLRKAGAPHLMATPDGIVYNRDGVATHGLEIKTHTIHLAHGYGAEGTDEVPYHELIQCLWNMAVTGLRRWDLVVFIDGQPRDYSVAWDESIIEMLITAANRFLVDHVQANVPPPADGSEGYSDFIRMKFPGSDGSLKLVDINDPIMGAVSRLHEARDAMAANKKLAAIARQEIELFIGASDGLKMGAGKKPEKITFKKNKDGTQTNWREVAAFLEIYVDPMVADAAKESHTVPKIGPRVFRVPASWGAEEKE